MSELAPCIALLTFALFLMYYTMERSQSAKKALFDNIASCLLYNMQLGLKSQTGQEQVFGAF